MFDLSAYQISWAFLFLGALIVSLVIYYWLRRSFGAFVGVFCSVILFTFLLAPAPVPNYEGFYAPACFVYIFETFFQIQGAPALSGKILLFSMSALTVLLLAGGYFFRAKERE
jgi:hypothetical protein